MLVDRLQAALDERSSASSEVAPAPSPARARTEPGPAPPEPGPAGGRPRAAAPGEEEPAPPVSAQVQAARALRAQRAAAAGSKPIEAAGAPSERDQMAAMGLPTSLGAAAAPTVSAAPAEAPGTQKTCKHCGQALSQSMFVEKQWKKPRPTCVDCASRLSAQNATRTKQPPPSSGVSVRQQLEHARRENWGQAFPRAWRRDGSVAPAFFTFPATRAAAPTTARRRRPRADDRRVPAAAVRKRRGDLTADGCA